MTQDTEALKAGEPVEYRAREMLQDLIGNRYSDTTLRVATDWLKQERRLALKPSPTPDAGEVRERIKEALREAYIAGATDVHTYWAGGGELPNGDPDFDESADDFATHALDPFSSKVRGIDLSILALSPQAPFPTFLAENAQKSPGFGEGMGKGAVLREAADYLDGYAGGHYMAQSCAQALRGLAIAAESTPRRTGRRRGGQ